MAQSKHALQSMTILGSLLGAASALVGPALAAAPAPVADAVQTAQQTQQQVGGLHGWALWGFLVGLVLALVGRFRKGDLHLFGGSMAALAALLLTLPACQALTPNTGSSPVAPVAQAGGIYAPTWIMAVPGADKDGKFPEITFQIGHSSDGNTEGKGGSSKLDAKQENTPKLGVGDKALDALKPVPELALPVEKKKPESPVPPKPDAQPATVPPATPPKPEPPQ